MFNLFLLFFLSGNYHRIVEKCLHNCSSRNFLLKCVFYFFNFSLCPDKNVQIEKRKQFKTMKNIFKVIKFFLVSLFIFFVFLKLFLCTVMNMNTTNRTSCTQKLILIQTYLVGTLNRTLVQSITHQSFYFPLEC